MTMERYEPIPPITPTLEQYIDTYRQVFPHTTLAKYISLEVAIKVFEQNMHRKSWERDDTAEVIEGFLDEEFDELLEAEQVVMIGGGAMELVSEIDDIFYLTLKLQKLRPNQPLPNRVRHYIEHCLELCELTGIDINEAMWFKIWRNEYKYVQMISNNGYSGKQSRRLSKQMYQKLMGGDHHFYEVYNDMADELMTHEAE